MQRIILLTILLLFTTPILWSQGSLLIVVEGIRNKKGKIYIGLHNSEESYKSAKKNYYRIAIIDLKKDSNNYLINDLPAGTYAFELFHDEDENKKLNTNFVGMPKEGFGFSNNALTKMRMPTFEEMSFNIENGKKTTQRIKLKYL